MQPRLARRVRLSAEANGWLNSRITLHNAAVGGPRQAGLALVCHNVSSSNIMDMGRCRQAHATPSTSSGTLLDHRSSAVPYITVDELVPTGQVCE